MDVKKYIAPLAIIPILLLTGCTNNFGGFNNQKAVNPAASMYKCTLPSKPGAIQIQIDPTSLPNEIYVQEGSTTQEAFQAIVYNYMDKEANVEIRAVPIIGEISLSFKGTTGNPITVTLDPAEYYPDVGTLEPFMDYIDGNIIIPSEVSQYGAYHFNIVYSYTTSTEIYVPICIGYNPTQIRDVSPDIRVCDPLSVPQPCYSASPVVPSSVTTKVSGSKTYSRYIITIALSDSYGGVAVDEYGRKKVIIDDIILTIDSYTDHANSDLIYCTPSPGSKLYLNTMNTIRCTIDLNKVKSIIGDETALKLGKGALLSIKLSYAYEGVASSPTIPMIYMSKS